MLCHLYHNKIKIQIDLTDYVQYAIRLEYTPGEDDEPDSWSLPEGFDHYQGVENQFSELLRVACGKLNEETGSTRPRSEISIVLDVEAAQFLSETIEIYQYRCEAFYELRKLQGYEEEYDNGLPKGLWGFSVKIE